MLHSYYNCLRLNTFLQSKISPIRFKFKQASDRPVGEILTILGNQYRSDELTNIPDKVCKLIGRQLYLTEGNPIFLISQSIRQQFDQFSCFHFTDPVVSTWQNFDSILVPEEHISRRKTDTFYLNKNHVLRSHTSAHQSECFKKLAAVKSHSSKFIIIGDVYRRDEVNKTHHAAFHQCEVVELFDENQLKKNGLEAMFNSENYQRTDRCQEKHCEKVVTFVEQQLKSQTEAYIRRLFGQKILTRWVDAYFPFTHPSWELEIRLNDSSDWLEILGCGVIEQKILNRDGLANYVGWALGMGIERLAMLYYDIPDIRLFWTQDTGFTFQFEKLKPFDLHKYKAISTHPPRVFDISFWWPTEQKRVSQWSANDVHAIISEVGGDLIEQVHLVDQWQRPSDQRWSNCYRIVYRSHERALTNDEANVIHRKIEQTLTDILNIEIR